MIERWLRLVYTKPVSVGIRCDDFYPSSSRQAGKSNGSRSSKL